MKTGQDLKCFIQLDLICALNIFGNNLSLGSDPFCVKAAFNMPFQYLPNK